MRRLLHQCTHLALAAAVAVLSLTAHAAASQWIGDKRAQVRLVTSVDSVSGNTLEAALEFRYPPGWHGYWRTPGDAGIAPQLDWSRTPATAGTDIHWPAPSRLIVEDLQNAVIVGDVLLPLDIRLRRANLDDARMPVHLALSLDYATCANVCVPEHADLTLDLPRAIDGEAALPSQEAGAINAARRRLPGTLAAAKLSLADARVTTDTGVQRLTVALHSKGAAFDKPDLFVEGAGGGLPPRPRVVLSHDGHDAAFDVSLPSPAVGAGASRLTLTLVDGSRTATFDIPGIGVAATRSNRGADALWSILLVALAGGLILNAMPCVLPVLSLKAFSLIKASGESRGMTRRLAGATALGIIASFLLLAVVLSVVKLAGATIGWGIQFQQPWFLATMATITAIFAASLLDWLPLRLPTALADFAVARSSCGPYAEAFLSGAFSTLLATPCSAPFVGTATGFALARSPVDIVAVLSTMGVGMALPFIALALFPAAAAWLPRPGAWMRWLRVALGAMLFGTVVWLLVVLATVAGTRSSETVALLLAALIGVLVLIAQPQRAAAQHWPKALSVALAVGVIAVTSGRNDQQPLGATHGSASASASRWPVDGYDWQPFDPKRIETLIGEGKTVFVDVTATWCLTCKVNELTVLSQADVKLALKAPDVVRMRADWSHVDPLIARYVQSFGRAGIPLDVVYGPARVTGEALPELLNASVLTTALARARGGA